MDEKTGLKIRYIVQEAGKITGPRNPNAFGYGFQGIADCAIGIAGFNPERYGYGKYAESIRHTCKLKPYSAPDYRPIIDWVITFFCLAHYDELRIPENRRAGGVFENRFHKLYDTVYDYSELEEWGGDLEMWDVYWKQIVDIFSQGTEMEIVEALIKQTAHSIVYDMDLREEARKAKEAGSKRK